TTFKGKLSTTSQRPSTTVNLATNRIVLNAPLAAPGDDVHFKSREGMSVSESIQAHVLWVEGPGLGSFLFSSHTNRIDMLRADISGSLEITDTRSLVIGTAGTYPAIRTNGHPVTIRDDEDVTFTGVTQASGAQLSVRARDI